jgi:predicted  nucleic acid-binding Zn-ribbon protein
MKMFSPRILVIDDEMIVCESCQRILLEEISEVECVFSG